MEYKEQMIKCYYSQSTNFSCFCFSLLLEVVKINSKKYSAMKSNH